MWKIYSPEDFPKKGRQAEYLSAYGYQLEPVKANTWVELPDTFIHECWTDFIHVADVNNPKQTPVRAKKLAEHLVMVHGERGLVACEWSNTNAEERKHLENQSKAKNHNFRKQTVEKFEQQYREKMRGEPGRLIPSDYEMECYEMLGLKVPELTQEAGPQKVEMVVPNMEAMFEAWAQKRGLAKLADELGTPSAT